MVAARQPGEGSEKQMGVTGTGSRQNCIGSVGIVLGSPSIRRYIPEKGIAAMNGPDSPESRPTPPPDSQPPDELAEVLESLSRGDAGARDRLLPLVYEELRVLARARMREVPPGQTLEPTALVHEAWVRIADRRPDGWANRAEFFHAAARAMRDIIVEDARRKGSLKRGGDRRRVVLDEVWELAVESPTDDVVALDEAISILSEEHPSAAEVVNLRFFAGLTVDEVAAVRGASASTVEREWRFARAWLRGKLGERGEAARD